LYILIQGVGHKPHFPRYSGSTLRDSQPYGRARQQPNRPDRRGHGTGQASGKLPGRDVRRRYSRRRPDFQWKGRGFAPLASQLLRCHHNSPQRRQYCPTNLGSVRALPRRGDNWAVPVRRRPGPLLIPVLDEQSNSKTDVRSLTRARASVAGRQSLRSSRCRS
jgi:hypothetical protein